MIEKNVEFLAAKKLSPWRKISFGSWRPTGDSSIYTSLHLPVANVKAYLKENNIDMHIFLIKMLAHAIAKNPHINGVIRFGKFYPRKNVDIFYHVVSNMKEAEDLSGLVIRKADKRSWRDVGKEFKTKVIAIKKGTDKSYDQIKKSFGLMPGILARPVLDLCAFLLYNLNLWSPLLGSPKDSFGSVMLTNIGSFGADQAYCPIAPYTRIPMVVSAGKVAKRPFVIGDKVEAVETIYLSFTYDHRIMDGVQYQWLANTIKDIFMAPQILDQEFKETINRETQSETVPVFNTP